MVLDPRDKGKGVLPGYTVITSNISAAFAISSVIAVEGVSGEIATPAFIFRSCILSISATCLSFTEVRFLHDMLRP